MTSSSTGGRRQSARCPRRKRGYNQRSFIGCDCLLRTSWNIAIVDSMATENFKTLREVAIAIDGLKTSIDGIRGQLALMTLVFAGFAAASVGAFGYFFIDSKSSATALVRIETLQQAQNMRFDSLEKRLDNVERRLDQIVGLLQPKQQGQLGGRASVDPAGMR